ncbi:MAG: DUF4349 domain-containing protein, partial [Methanomicrobiaceae archaeon]|nr:DUF4349 domain-containing protein [Methanomicrobiaceae archaeon]
QSVSAPSPAMETSWEKSADIYSSGTGNDGGSADTQKFISTAHLDLDTPDVSRAARECEAVAVVHGGFASSSSLSTDATGKVYGTVVLRVPAVSFRAAMDALEGLGEVKRSSIDSSEVTEEYVDLTARLEALSHQKEQYLRIMEKAETVEDILKVQTEIERVQVEIERITGRLRYLDNRIDLATITISLREPVVVGATGGHDFTEVFNEAIKALLFTVDALIVLVFALLPLAVIAGLGYGLYRWNRRRRAEEKDQ